MNRPENAPIPDYVGDEICFYEMPYGCEIVTEAGYTFVIRSPKDAEALANSLLEMVKAFSENN